MVAVIRIPEDELGWNESIRTYQGAPFTGVSFRLHPNGVLMFEVPYIDGRADGLMREWDAEGRLIYERVLGESLLKKLEPDDPDYGWVTELAEQALARLSPKAVRAMEENALPSGIETTEYRYDAGGNLLYQLKTRRP